MPIPLIAMGVGAAVGAIRGHGRARAAQMAARNEVVGLNNQYLARLLQEKQFSPYAAMARKGQAQLFTGIMKSWGLDKMFEDGFLQKMYDAKAPGYDAPDIMPTDPNQGANKPGFLSRLVANALHPWRSGALNPMTTLSGARYGAARGQGPAQGPSTSGFHPENNTFSFQVPTTPSVAGATLGGAAAGALEAGGSGMFGGAPGGSGGWGQAIAGMINSRGGRFPSGGYTMPGAGGSSASGITWGG